MYRQATVSNPDQLLAWQASVNACVVRRVQKAVERCLLNPGRVSPLPHRVDNDITPVAMKYGFALGLVALFASEGEKAKLVAIRHVESDNLVPSQPRVVVASAVPQGRATRFVSSLRKRQIDPADIPPEVIYFCQLWPLWYRWHRPFQCTSTCATTVKGSNVSPLCFA